MRHIPGHLLRPSQDWIDRATEARAKIHAIAVELEDATSGEREFVLARLSKEISKHNDLWKELKPDLKSLSYHKCWYCETLEKRSHTAVDHFRPKGDIFECPSHPGYWWLALSPENFRYACTYCNSLLAAENAAETLGKGTHFPLENETRRQFCPQDANEEIPTLLDPVVGADPFFLSFTTDGRATPRYSKDKSILFFSRAERSIGVYHLNHSDITSARSVIAFEINLQVMRAEKFLDRAMSGDVNANDGFQEAVRGLRGLIRPDSEYSSAAKTFLSAHRDKEWVEAALTTT